MDRANPKSVSYRILVALRTKDFNLVREALEMEFDIVPRHTFEQAQQSLAEHIDLIVCGVHFSSGKMFEFLRYVRNNPDTHSLPFYVVLRSGRGYTQAIIQSIERAVHLLGANGFANISELEARFGKEEGYERLRQALRRALSK